MIFELTYDIKMDWQVFKISISPLQIKIFPFFFNFKELNWLFLFWKNILYSCLLLDRYRGTYCRERSEVTLHSRLFIFNGIPMFLIWLTWEFLQSGGGGVGRENQLLDGYIYVNSDFTIWKLLVPNVCISNFMTIPSSVNVLRPI